MSVVDWAKQRVEAYLARKQLAYKRKFAPTCQDTDVVLGDLAKFCRAGETPFHKDERMHYVLIGRQEVWLRIQQYLNLPLDKLYELRGGPKE